MRKTALHKILLGVSAMALIGGLAACQNTGQTDTISSVTVELPSELQSNTLLAEWTGPFGGVPAFDKVKLEDLKPALEYGMKRNLEEIDIITANSEAPTFENTIVALERTGSDLDRIFTHWGIWSSNMSSPEFRAIQGEMAPKLSAFSSKITQNEALFQRVKAVYESDVVKSMRPDQQRLVQLTYDGFARNGATLNDVDKVRYAEINQRLATLHTKFANNVLNDEESYVTPLTKDQLGGLPDSYIAAAKAV